MIKLNIDLYCQQCIKETGINESSDTKMEFDGPLYTNPETKSMCQDYKCPSCKDEICVVVTPITDNNQLTHSIKDKTK